MTAVKKRDPSPATPLLRAQAYERHIALEEAELLPLARRTLDARTVAMLGRAMAVRRGAS